MVTNVIQSGVVFIGSSVITTTLCSTANGESLKVLYIAPSSLGIILETLNVPETMQLFSNSTPRVASTPNKTKTNHHWLNHQTLEHKLNYATSLVVGLSGSSHTSWWGNQRKSWLTSPPHITSLTPETKDKNLVSPSILISLSYTRNKEKNSSTG